jgi:hypothetical protein
MTKKFIKKCFIVSIFLFITNNAFAATGPATEYKVTMTKLELCEEGSSQENVSIRW